MKKELRRSIKEDELVSGVERVMTFVVKNRTQVQYAALALVLAIGGGWGYSAWRAQQSRDAEAAFASALEIFSAPVRAELPAGAQLPEGTRVFDTAAEKFEQAAAAFDGVERRFGSHPVGLRARYFSALARIESGHAAEARKILEDLAARGGGGLEPALARLALAELLRKLGETDKAVEEFRKLASDPAWPLPKDYALMELAQTLDDAKKAAEARSAYQRLVDEYPASVFAAEARRRAENLEAAG